MRKIYSVISGLTLLVLLTSVNFVFSQSVGISITGPFTPNTSALLDVSATSKGVLIPRVALTGVNDATTIISPATSLLVYNDGTGGLSTAGYYYNSGTSGAPNWVRFLTSSSASWLTGGNNNGSEMTLGTQDIYDLPIISYNKELMRLTTTGRIGISTTTPVPNYLITMNANGASTQPHGINIIMTPNSSNSYGIRISSNSQYARGINVVNTSNGTSNAFWCVGGVDSVTNVVSGYLAYRTGSGNTYGLYGITGTNSTPDYTNSSTWAAFIQGRAVISSESSPTSLIGTDLEIRNTSSGKPVLVSFRRSNQVTSRDSVITKLIFRDSYYSGPQAQISIIRDQVSSHKTDLPTAIQFFTMNDSSKFNSHNYPSVLSEKMRIKQSGTVQIGKIGSSANLNWCKLYVDNTGQDGTGYGLNQVGAGILGYAGGPQTDTTVNTDYAYGVAGFCYNLTGLTRSGGVFGGVSVTNWGSLGYYSSAGGAAYGAYYHSTGGLGTGTGFMPNSDIQGIGFGSYGGVMGGWTRGEVLGQTNMGELYASYNIGNQYTSGVSADIVTNNNERTPAYSVTSNDVKVYSDGKAKLINGSCKVTFDRSFLQLLSQQDNPTITVSALGECAGLYIVSIEKDGFTVKEFHNGQSNVEFTWIAIGKRVDANQVSKLPEALKDKDFDANMKRVMFNENNTEKSGLPIWWDGSKLRFDTPPVQNTDTKKN